MLIDELKQVKKAEEEASAVLAEAKAEALELLRTARAEAERVLETDRREGSREGEEKTRDILNGAASDVATVAQEAEDELKQLREVAVGKQTEAAARLLAEMGIGA